MFVWAILLLFPWRSFASWKSESLLKLIIIEVRPKLVSITMEREIVKKLFYFFFPFLDQKYYNADGDTEVIPVKQATMVQNQRSKVETCVRPQQPAMFSVNQAAKRSLPDSTSGVPAAKKLQGDDLFPDDDDDIFLQVPVDSRPPLTSRHQQTGANQQTVVENHQPTNNHRTIDKQSDDRRQLPATIQRPFVYLRTLNVKDDQIVCVKVCTISNQLKSFPPDRQSIFFLPRLTLVRSARNSTSSMESGGLEQRSTMDLLLWMSISVIRYLCF